MAKNYGSNLAGSHAEAMLSAIKEDPSMTTTVNVEETLKRLIESLCPNADFSDIQARLVHFELPNPVRMLLIAHTQVCLLLTLGKSITLDPDDELSQELITYLEILVREGK